MWRRNSLRRPGYRAEQFNQLRCGQDKKQKECQALLKQLAVRAVRAYHDSTPGGTPAPGPSHQTSFARPRSLPMRHTLLSVVLVLAAAGVGRADPPLMLQKPAISKSHIAFN